MKVSTKQITINPLDPNSIEEGIRLLKAYKEWIERKTDELMKELANIGLETATVHFADADIDGNDDVSLSVEKVDNGYLITASGKSVCFLEFGAGVTAGAGYDTSKVTPPVPTEPGSWSKDHAQQFSRKGRWYYDGKRYTQVVPRMGMAHAANEIESQILSVAKRVFK